MRSDTSFLNAVFPLLDRGDEAGAMRLVEGRLARDPGDADANKMLKRDYRKPYIVPEKV